jgi:hypothetical protein
MTTPIENSSQRDGASDFDFQQGEWQVRHRVKRSSQDAWIEFGGTLDPPVKGHFENGIGTFYSDYIADGKAMRVRFVWSRISANSARWEQANSSDEGKTWASNWTMEFERTAP